MTRNLPAALALASRMPAPPPHLHVALILFTLAGCGEPGAPTTGASDSATSTTDPATSDSPTSDPETSDSATADPATSDPSTSGSTTSGSTTSSGPTTSGPTTSTTSEPTGSGSTTGAAEQLPPTDSADALEQWLADGAYRQWPAESQVHPSDGPHGGNVRTYVNTALLQSLADGAAMHPQDAATVKELYGASEDTLIGYAVMVKLAPDSAGGDGWYWYERLNGTVYADGTGVGLCSSCHVGGADYILTPYPLQ